MLNFGFERKYWKNGLGLVAGVDEAGRGPLAGPVVAAAVVFPPEVWIQGVNDSKKLTARRREELFDVIQQCALGVGVGIVSHETIDRINIYQASMLAMTEAIAKLDPKPQHLLIDGPHFIGNGIPYTAIVEGDAQCSAIAAASIIAKVTRDRLMIEYNELYPEYGFVRHKGYCTPEHVEAIHRYGPCEIHRRSFRVPAQPASIDVEQD